MVTRHHSLNRFWRAGQSAEPTERYLEGITALHLGNWSCPAVPGENGLIP